MGIDYDDLPFGQLGVAEYLTSTQEPRVVTATLLRRRINDPEHVLCRLEISHGRFIALGPGQLVNFEPRLFRRPSGQPSEPIPHPHREV